MKNKQDVSKREKSAAVGLVVCFVAMIAVVGMITFSQYQQKAELEEGQQLAQTDDTKDKSGIGEDIQGDSDTNDSQAANTDSIQAEIETPAVDVAPSVPQDAIAPSAVEPSGLHFAPNDVLIWPVDGNVVLSYSMDRTIYFSTLNQYKYNPAIVIGGEVGMDVLAAAEGRVTSIETTAQTGTTITMDLGDGYEVVYGQLKEVCVHEGDIVSQGDVIGYLSEPTKYYSVEGPNLYFQMLEDGQPVNPLEFMEA